MAHAFSMTEYQTVTVWLFIKISTILAYLATNGRMVHILRLLYGRMLKQTMIKEEVGHAQGNRSDIRLARQEKTFVNRFYSL